MGIVPKSRFIYRMRSLTYIPLLLLTLLFCLQIEHALGQEYTEQDTTKKRFKVYEHEGQTYMFGELEGIDILANKPSKRELRRGKKRLARFTRLRWNVHKVYPYAVKVSDVLAQVEKELEAIPDEEAKKEYVKAKEKSLFGAHENDIRKMTRSQGKVLVKLINRETGKSTFDVIRDAKSGASALLWQSIGLIFGINLKTKYDEEEDAMIEQIVEDLEEGGYNIAYRRYNYSIE